MTFLKITQSGPDDPGAAVIGWAATDRLINEAWIDFGQAMRDKGDEDLPRGDIGNGHKQSGQAGKGTPGVLSQLHDSIQDRHRSGHSNTGRYGGDPALGEA